MHVMCGSNGCMSLQIRHEKHDYSECVNKNITKIEAIVWINVLKSVTYKCYNT